MTASIKNQGLKEKKLCIQFFYDQAPRARDFITLSGKITTFLRLYYSIKPAAPYDFFKTTVSVTSYQRRSKFKTRHKLANNQIKESRKFISLWRPLWRRRGFQNDGAAVVGEHAGKFLIILISHYVGYHSGDNVLKLQCRPSNNDVMGLNISVLRHSNVWYMGTHT